MRNKKYETRAQTATSHFVWYIPSLTDHFSNCDQIDMSTGKRTVLTLDQKQQVRVHIGKSSGIQVFQVQEWVRSQFKVTISPATARRLLQAPADAFSGPPGRKKLRRVRFPAFEASMLAFYKLNDGKAILTDGLLLEEARSIRDRMKISETELRISNGWLEKFKLRHGITQHTLHGEADSVNRAELTVSQMEFADLIGKYNPENVFNFDESALFYRLPPNKTLATLKRSGTKAEKERVTVGLCCNLPGSEKMDPVVIGKAERPLAFRKVQIANVAFKYYNNRTAWQTRATFGDWLRHFDAKMYGRKVLLLIDNASSHYVSYQSRNVKVMFLPPNMTSKIQPLDAGKGSFTIRMDHYLH